MITHCPDHDGDPHDWKALYAAYAPRLRQVIVLLTPPDDVDDVLHNTFLRFIRRLDGGHVDFSRPVWPLLATMARRESVDRLRAARSQASRSGLYRQAAAHDVAERVETRAAISTTLLALSARDRRLLIRYELGAQSPAVLAEAEGLSTGALRVAVCRARQKFRDAYLATGTARWTGALVAWAASKRGRRPTVLENQSALEFIRFAIAVAAVAAAAVAATAHRPAERRPDPTVAAIRDVPTVDSGHFREEPALAPPPERDPPGTQTRPRNHGAPTPSGAARTPIAIRRVEGRVSPTPEDLSVGVAIEWSDPLGVMHTQAMAGMRCRSGVVAGVACPVLRRLPGTTAAR